MTRPTTEWCKGCLHKFANSPLAMFAETAWPGDRGISRAFDAQPETSLLAALEIENFKGIAARQRIEGSAADGDRTELGRSVLELGAFACLIHKHATERAIECWAQDVHEDDRSVTLVGARPRGGHLGQ